MQEKEGTKKREAKEEEEEEEMDSVSLVPVRR